MDDGNFQVYLFGPAEVRVEDCLHTLQVVRVKYSLPSGQCIGCILASFWLSLGSELLFISIQELPSACACAARLPCAVSQVSLRDAMRAGATQEELLDLIHAAVSTVLYCAVLCCAVPYCAVLYCAVCSSSVLQALQSVTS